METSPLNALISHAITPTALLDTNLSFLNYSSHWPELFIENRTDAIGCNFNDNIQGCPPLFIKALQASQKGVESKNEGQRFLLPNGKHKWFKWKITPWRNGENELRGTIIFLENISKEKKEQELLNHVGSLYKVGGWEVDLVDNTLFWTETTKMIHEVDSDYTPNLNHAIEFYKKGNHRNKITELLSTAIQNGQSWNTESILITAKGKEIWIRTKAVTEMLNGKCVRLFGTIQDITQEKQSLLNYNKINNRLQIAVNAGQIGIWEFDIATNELIWDHNMYNIYGINKEDFTGVFEAWESVVHPDDVELGKLAVEKAFSTGEKFNIEFRIIWPTGEIRHIKALAEIRTKDCGMAPKLIGANWDITTLKKTRLQLEKSEESFMGTFENSATGMTIVGLDGKLTKVNASFCKSLGYTEKELLQLSFEEFTHPDDLRLDLVHLQEILYGLKESYEIETKYIHKDGHYVYVFNTITAMKTIAGNISSFIVNTVDVTAKKNIELKLKETSERLKIATRSANIGVWDYEIESNNLNFNENMFNIYGIAKDTPNILRAWADTIHVDDKKRILQDFTESVKKNKTLHTRFRLVDSNGNTKYILASGEPQKNEGGKVTKVIGMSFDLTELKNAELRLERSNESFSEIFNNSAIGMAIMGSGNKILKANQSLCTSLGYSEDELKQMTMAEITYPDDIEHSERLLTNTTNQHEINEFQKRCFHKNGHIVHVIVAVTVVNDLNGKFSHSIAQVLDITESISATKKLNTLVNITKEQNDSLLNFAHIVSHNLRSHSANMTMLTGFIASEEDKNELKELNGMLSDAVDSLSVTIADLNEVVTIKTSTANQLKSVNVLNTFTNAQSNIKGLIKKEKATFSIQISKTHFVSAVPSYLESILLNLITNSLKYKSPERNPHIEIKTIRKDHTIVLTFKDNGQGIDMERYGDKIFGMYKTFHNHKDAKGIGLFITKNQIETMGGKIVMDSKVGEYTETSITLKVE